jgi:hypothetical protein
MSSNWKLSGLGISIWERKVYVSVDLGYEAERDGGFETRRTRRRLSAGWGGSDGTVQGSGFKREKN